MLNSAYIHSSLFTPIFKIPKGKKKKNHFLTYDAVYHLLSFHCTPRRPLGMARVCLVSSNEWCSVKFSGCLWLIVMCDLGSGVQSSWVQFSCCNPNWNLAMKLRFSCRGTGNWELTSFRLETGIRTTVAVFFIDPFQWHGHCTI
jgi:hypothetical protein